MSGPISLALLPRTATVTDAGRLVVGGCDVAELARGFGTPLVVYDEMELRARCREYAAAFGAGRVAYASKAFLCQAMARLVNEEGLSLDVATGGELYIALTAGFPAHRLVFHGNNKSDDELCRALEAGVGRIVVDSFDEMDRIERLVSDEGHEPPAVLIRVTPDVEAGDHGHIQTGMHDSKFGFAVRGGAALDAARRAAESATMRFLGVHAHIGSQVLSLDAYAQSADVVAVVLAEIEAATGDPIEEVNLGGGLGIAYLSDDDPPSIAEYATALKTGFARACEARGVSRDPHIVVEPGRSIAGPAGFTLYRVGTIKEVDGVRTYAAVDGGMSDNPRPSMYGARYEAFLPDRVTAARPRVVTVAGKHCEQGDILILDASVPDDLAVGDVLATPSTGAYAYSMASNYNAQTRPAVLFVRDGEARVVVRRETLDDLLHLDAAPSAQVGDSRP